MAAYIRGAGILWVTFVIPTTIIGTIGGAFITSVLAIWEKRLPNVLASLIGLTLGLIIMLIVNHFIWLNNYFGAICTATFLEFVFPMNKDFAHLAIYENPFVIPSIIAILLSAFCAWQINKTFY